jgi:hypothetical protein
MAVGGAARVSLGDLGSPEHLVDDTGDGPIELQGFTSRGGLAPVAMISLPMAKGLDFSVQAAGSALALAVRRGFDLGGNSRLVAGLAPYAGWMLLREPQGGDGAAGWRLGASTPWVFTLDIGGVYEAWAGARAGIEHARCRLEEERLRVALRGTLFRLGALAGVGIGFRRLHALFELGMDREWWWMGGDIEPAQRAGFALTPAFALRLRF